MSNTFFDESKKIADNYIQSIAFLDDRAYRVLDEAKPNNDFDVLKITKAFAENNKICAVYQPESENDIENFMKVTNKADAIVLDWEINFTKEVEPGSEEEDDDHAAGLYTKRIIKSTLYRNNELKKELKIIIVYTGDYMHLDEILQEIYKTVFLSNKDFKMDLKTKSINSIDFKILVRAKTSVINNETNRHLEDFMVNYEDMPNFILTEFTNLTSGLLSNFALLSLTTLRKNSSKILGLFSKDMDNAYLGHKAIIPKQEDAEDLLIELFGDSVKDLLYYSSVNGEIRSSINNWIDNNLLEEKFEYEGRNFTKDRSVIKNVLESTEEDIKKRFNSVFRAIPSQIKNHLTSNSSKIFTNNDKQDTVKEQDRNFAKLTHHKSLFIPKEVEPKLTLGTLIKSTKEDKFYICIQQRCDSVRIPKDSVRKFLFLPFYPTTGASTKKFHLITSCDIELKKDTNSFSMRTIKFKCDNDFGVIKAKKNRDNKYIFTQKYVSDSDEQFEWMLDLKDLHSQRIVTEYAASISRVGLDESEWLRKSGL